MTLEKFVSLASASYAALWQDFEAMSRHERFHLLACMGIAFVFVYGLVAFVAMNP